MHLFNKIFNIDTIPLKWKNEKGKSHLFMKDGIFYLNKQIITGLYLLT